MLLLFLEGIAIISSNAKKEMWVCIYVSTQVSITLGSLTDLRAQAGIMWHTLGVRGLGLWLMMLRCSCGAPNLTVYQLWHVSKSL